MHIMSYLGQSPQQRGNERAFWLVFLILNLRGEIALQSRARTRSFVKPSSISPKDIYLNTWRQSIYFLRSKKRHAFNFVYLLWWRSGFPYDWRKYFCLSCSHARMCAMSRAVVRRYAIRCSSSSTTMLWSKKMLFVNFQIIKANNLYTWAAFVAYVLQSLFSPRLFLL